MKRTLSALLAILLIFLILGFSTPLKAHAQSAEPVVRAILFYSPTCPHCAAVIQESLPPLFDKYDTQLEIIGIDVSSAQGVALYQAAITRFQIPDNRLGVPTLIIDQTVLVGSLEIPDQFPGLIEHYLSQGGIDWPDIPGLVDILTAPVTEQPPEHALPAVENSPAPLSPTAESATVSETPLSTQATPVPTITPAPTATPGLAIPVEHNSNWTEKFARDLAGNSLSVIVLLGMLGALMWGLLYFSQNNNRTSSVTANWLVPLASLIGIFVAAYLAYVETAQVSAVCGPVGDCNTVQQSEYARLFGILPIGLLGLAGYLAILLAWLGARFGRNGVQYLGALALLTFTFAGTLFSIYLTFLEPFVIGATCAWCLTSAIVMTILMLLSLGPGKSAYLVLVKKR